MVARQFFLKTNCLLWLDDIKKRQFFVSQVYLFLLCVQSW